MRTVPGYGAGHDQGALFPQLEMGKVSAGDGGLVRRENHLFRLGPSIP